MARKLGHNSCISTAFLALHLCIISISSCTDTGDSRPNIVLIMADDLGFSDLGCYGSEIQTPNIDRLADEGIRFTNFYNAARCCPTRASLLTGLYPHETGIGGMVTREPAKSAAGPYQGYLNNHCVTLAEVLGNAGYTTLMSGKWHVGEEHPQWPMDRGFHDYFGLISGAAHYFDIRRTKQPGLSRHFARGNEEYLPPAEGWYMTDALTDNAVRMLEQQKAGEKPFFLYLAYTAPHWPLHAWAEDIEKYRGKYIAGWDSLRLRRYHRQLEMQLFDKPYPLSPRDPNVPAWESLDQVKKTDLDLKMAVYAAQIECMDRGIGRVIDKLTEIGQKENTLILFLSDNGGCAEGGVFGQDFWGNSAPPGGPDGYHNYGMGWANASNTPFRKFKQYTHEGGIATPFIASWPAEIKIAGGIDHQPAHIIDIMATFLEIAEIDYPENYHGYPIRPSEGKSLLPLFKGLPRGENTRYCWEHLGSAAIREGSWKLVAEQDQPWELFNLSEDRTELTNLITDSTEIARKLHQNWLAWAEQCGVKVQNIHRKMD